MIDTVEIYTVAGSGGRGVVSFRREKFVPRGGPDGGDGGRGGTVYLEASTNLNTFQPFHWQQRFRAEDGLQGKGRNRRVRDGENLVIQVPVGTVAYG